MAVLSVVSIFPALAAAIVIYVFALAGYRLCFHPLAQYPGPFWNKLSEWPEVRFTCQGRRHIDFHLMHEKYGDIVRYAPDSLSFRNPGAIHDIYTDRRANLIKTGWAETSLKLNPTTATTQIISDRALHASRRRLLNNAFSESALKNLEKFVLETIRAWCVHLQEPATTNNDEKPPAGEWSRAKDMGVWSTLLTIDVLGELCFGKAFGAMQHGYSYISELILSSTWFGTVLAPLPIRELLYPFLRQPWLLKALGSKSVAQKALYRQEMSKLVQSRFTLEQANAEKSSEDQRKDFYHYLLNAKDPETGEKFLPKDLVGEAALLVAAGSDTSSTAMSATFFYLMRHERVYKKLQAEVRGTFTDIEQIRYGPKLFSLHYLRACIDEAMRMSPPVPGMLDRIVLPGGAVIDGTTYPEGTKVGVPTYAVHHNENLYPQNFSYIPERWIVGSHDKDDIPITVTPTSVELAKSAFHPFSSGPRGCVGKNMAYMELLIAIGRAVWLFDIRKKEGDRSGEGGQGKDLGREREGEYQLRDWFIAERYGPVLEFRRREV